jgi:predicted nucleic acid-binding protein
MKVAVKDANVFIDLESMGILDLWFQLDYPTMTSSFVVMELAAGGHENALACVRAGQIAEVVIDGEEMVGPFEELRCRYEATGLSVSDLSVLYLAIREQAILLTGDRLLRSEAGLNEVEVHGTLWILEQLIDHGLLPAAVAADRLEQLIRRTGRERRFLPPQECETRIAKWRRR